MKKVQNIKNFIILSIIAVILAISCVFYQKINSFAYKFLFNKEIVLSENNLLVHFISVGQGDAMAINFPSGKTMVIDCGPKESNVDYVKYIKNKVLNNSISNKIDYLILTHADDDHIGGTKKLLTEFDVGCVYLPYVEKKSKTYEEMRDYVNQNCNYKVLEGNLDIEEEGIEILNFQMLNKEEPNDACPVIKLTHKNKSFLFAADIPTEVENEFVLEYKEKLSAQVLKVAHHGSEDSSSKDFLKAVNPDYAIISVGANGYGHPTQQVLERLTAAESKVLRTDKNGNILFVVGNNYNLSYTAGEYYIATGYFDYRIAVLIMELGVIIVACIMIVKFSKQNKLK